MAKSSLFVWRGRLFEKILLSNIFSFFFWYNKSLIHDYKYRKKVKCYLYKLSLPDESLSEVSHIYIENIKTNQKKTVFYNLYDIYPLIKQTYEEFEIYCPSKVEKILEKEHFQLDYICFQNTDSPPPSSFIPPTLSFLSNPVSNPKRELIEEGKFEYD